MADAPSSPKPNQKKVAEQCSFGKSLQNYSCPNSELPSLRRMRSILGKEA